MIKQCADTDVLSKIINHPKVKHWLTDNNSSKDHEPVVHPSIIYLVDDLNRGMVRVDPVNRSTCSVHIATTPEMWGSARKFAQDAVSWIFKNTLYVKIMALIPDYNKCAVKLVEDVGASKEGLLTRSFYKNWVFHDQIIFGLSKGEFKWQ